MQVKILKVGYLQTNCYILVNGDKCLIIDPGDDPHIIENQVGNLKVVGILITHRHHDHIGALDAIVKRYGAPIYDRSNLEEKDYEIDNFKFRVIYNPGHTDDSISFYFYEYLFIFDGDFIFKNTIGRCDLEGGDINKMYDSLRKISNYNRRIKLYPGHGEPTIMGDELDSNYYIKQAVNNF